MPPLALIDQLARRLERSLAATARVGYRTAQQEIRALRSDTTVRAVYEIPDAGRYADLARAGLAGALALISFRSRQAADNIAEKVAATPETDPALRTAAVLDSAQRALHNNVLELVGEALNMGRSAGALALPEPPRYAMRSEQLDKRTCSPCSAIHGQIFQIDSPDYYANMPPTGCLGGGRCRGVMVFSDLISDVRAPEPSEEELARIRRLARTGGA